MAWFKVFGQTATSGMMGDKKATKAERLRCPYFGCPSNTPFVGARLPRMKFVERPSPYVYTYRCKWCGCKVNWGADAMLPVPDQAHIRNRNFLIRK